MDVELRDIHKLYGNAHANRGISLHATAGSIHGILGENGAGKSTLMKILAGHTEMTSGAVHLDDRPVSYATPLEAMGHGIGMLCQDPLDFPSMTVLENFMLGQVRSFFPSRRRFLASLLSLCEQLRFRLDPSQPLEQLTFGERQQLELIRLLSLGVRALILDEPTTGISPEQKDILFDVLKQLAAQGKTILLVSHKLEDVEALCHRVTVLREGAVTGGLEAPLHTSEVLELMFGELPGPPPRCAVQAGEPVLALEGVAAGGGRTGFRSTTLSVGRGEVVGLAGLEGSGQEIFLRLAAGLQTPTEGSVHLKGTDMTGRDALDFRRTGVTFLPAARLEEGLIPGLSVEEHLAVADLRHRFFASRRDIRRGAEDLIRHFRIRGTPESHVEDLSGGNQQRLLLALIPPEADVLLLEQPTRGLDMESSHWFWKYLQKYCDRGATIVFSSAELDEILHVSHRVLVFCDGAVVLDKKTEHTHADELGRAIAGKV